ncbi:MAG: hypothetical protein K8L91_19755 [Anaerolineae bacterium]|nr:hypothetical protein [Anaerolineae bacterium]
MTNQVQLKCPICGGDMTTEYAVGLSFDIDDEHGVHSTEWFAIMWECPKGCSYAEDWWFDEDHRDFNETAVRNNQVYWYNPHTEEEIKKDDEHLIKVMG